MAKLELEYGLDDKSKRTLENELITSVLAQQLSRVCANKLTASNNASHSLEEYNNPNWPYKQADRIGYERAYQEIVNLLITKPKETK